MKTQKMSLANIQGKLSRAEMKNIMAGSGGANCPIGKACYNWYRGINGRCEAWTGNCGCLSGGASVYSPDCVGYWA